MEWPTGGHLTSVWRRSQFEDEDRFFGRERLLEELLTRLYRGPGRVARDVAADQEQPVVVRLHRPLPPFRDQIAQAFTPGAIDEPAGIEMGVRIGPHLPS